MSTDTRTNVPKLSQIQGQSHAIERLAREFETDRVHHAHLFAGPEGIGKATAARAWAARALCAEPQGMDACGHCPACLKLSNENHPDFMWVSPDGASIRIDQAREIAAATRYRPNEGRWRVIVIDECEKMGEAAANALLKTIEEPGGQTLFLLLTSYPNLLLPTIRSRCALVTFGRLTIEQTEAILRDQGVDESQIPTLARVARGAPGLAFALRDDEDWARRQQWLADLVRIAEGDHLAGLRFAAALAEDRDRALLEERLVVWMGLLRDAMVLSSTKRTALVHNQDAQEGMIALARALDISRAFAWMDAFERARRRVRGNVNLRLIMDSLVLELDEAQA